MAKATDRTAVYVRVSTRQQNLAMQEAALRRWAKAKGVRVRWYRDKSTGKTMNRPGWSKLEADYRAGKIDTLVVWKLDRLGRTTSGLTKLFDELRDRKIKLVSLTEGFDLSTSMGKLVADILASVAAYETEVRGDRVAEGQRAAMEAGKTWGGSKLGWTKLTRGQVDSILTLHGAGTSKRQIAKSMGLSWPTVSKIVQAHADGVELRCKRE